MFSIFNLQFMKAMHNMWLQMLGTNLFWDGDVIKVGRRLLCEIKVTRFTSAPGGFNDINDPNSRANVLSLLSSPAYRFTFAQNECLYIKCAERRHLTGEHTDKGVLQ